MARRNNDDDEHVCPATEAYMTTYADMITALLCLFVVLFAMSQIDLLKFERFKTGVENPVKVTSNRGNLDSGESIFEQAMVNPGITPPLNQTRPGDPAEESAAKAAEAEAFEQAQRQISEKLDGVTLGSQVRFQVERRGLVIVVVTDGVLFAPGDATLTATGDHIVSTLAGALTGLPNRITVEGHTDSTPISTDKFPSNWELSVHRAATVLRHLIDSHGLPARQLNAAGFADQRPVGPNDTAAGRSANRRVEVVVHSDFGDHTPDFIQGG